MHNLPEQLSDQTQKNMSFQIIVFTNRAFVCKFDMESIVI